MTDRKEHHFCFAYKGEQLRVTPFEKLHFSRVQGTSTIDGAQLVRVSLHRRNGRRESTIPRLIQEYNSMSGTDPITPCRFVPSQPTTVQCFKATQPDNPIVLRIESDRMAGSSRYWNWEAEPEGPVAANKKSKKGGFPGLEGLVRTELNLDPSALCMQSAYDQVARAYFQVYGIELKNSGAFPIEDKGFILSELRRHFDNERMYIVSPSTHSTLTPTAKAILDDTSIMGDLRFMRADGVGHAPPAPNGTVLRYLRKVLADENERDTVVTVPFQAILAEFNRESEGFYRRTCIVPFMTPFIATGAVVLASADTLQIHIRRVAEQLATLS
jgi:hypothetical protein